MAIAAGAAVVFGGMSAAQAAGSSWTVGIAPLPADAAGPAGATAQSSCATASFCAVVGVYYPTGANTHVPYVATWSNGTWTSTAAPLPSGASGDAYLAAVSCPSAGSCVAVGAYGSGAGTPLVETLDAGAWTAGNGGAMQGVLDDVSCNASTCVAVGQTNGGSPSAPLVLTRGDGSWSAPAVTWRGDREPPTISSVSCPATGACAAIGLGASGPMYFEPSGSGSLGRYFPSPSGHTSRAVSTISCWSDGDCAAIAAYDDGLRELGLADGAPTVRKVMTQTGLSAVTPRETSCRPDGDCAATVTAAAADGTTAGLVLKRTSGTWMSRLAPMPADRVAGTNYVVRGVSCTATSCVAVGNYMVQSGSRRVQRPLVETLTTGWRATGLGLPAGFDASRSAALTDVSCAGSTCVAVGGYSGPGATSPTGPIVAVKS